MEQLSEETADRLIHALNRLANELSITRKVLTECPRRERSSIREKLDAIGTVIIDDSDRGPTEPPNIEVGEPDPDEAKYWETEERYFNGGAEHG